MNKSTVGPVVIMPSDRPLTMHIQNTDGANEDLMVKPRGTKGQYDKDPSSGDKEVLLSIRRGLID